MRWQVISNWNGGKSGRTVEFTSKQEGIPGHNECFEWILRHTPFSYYEATTWQGYKIIGLEEIQPSDTTADGQGDTVLSSRGSR